VPDVAVGLAESATVALSANVTVSRMVDAEAPAADMPAGTGGALAAAVPVTVPVSLRRFRPWR